MQREGRRSLFLADRNCINDATHIETSEKAWTSGIGVGSAEQHFPFCAFTFTCAHTCFNCAAIAAALLRLKAPVALSENVHNELLRRGAGNGKRTWLSPGRMMTFPVAMVIGLIGLVRILSILLIFGASVLFGLQRGAVCGDTAIWIWLVSVQSTNYFARRG